MHGDFEAHDAIDVKLCGFPWTIGSCQIMSQELLENIDKSMTNMTSPWWKDVESLPNSHCDSELRSILVQLLALAIDHLIVKVKPQRRHDGIFPPCNHWRILSDSAQMGRATHVLAVCNPSLHKLHRT